MAKLGHKKESDSLCWMCENAYAKCSWSSDFIPVDGWDAEPTVIRNKATVDGIIDSTVNSYRVKSCPKFIQGPYLINTLMIKDRWGVYFNSRITPEVISYKVLTKGYLIKPIKDGSRFSTSCDEHTKYIYYGHIDKYNDERFITRLELLELGSRITIKSIIQEITYVGLDLKELSEKLASDWLVLPDRITVLECDDYLCDNIHKKLSTGKSVADLLYKYRISVRKRANKV